MSVCRSGDCSPGPEPTGDGPLCGNNPGGGVRGVQTLGFDLELNLDLDLDLAIALDATVANDIPDFDPGSRVTELADGVAIKLKDSSGITTPKLHQRMQAVAESNGIDHQLEVLPAGGTDTAGFQRARGARPVGAVSVPTRYLHTATETAHVDDIEATIELLRVFLESETGNPDCTP